MHWTFQLVILALQQLGGNRNPAFRIANAARPSAAYLLNQYLPEVGRPGYHVSSGNMTIRSLMAGLVGTSSPYPKGFTMEASSFLEKVAKVGQDVTLEEEALKEIQAIRDRLVTQGFMQGMDAAQVGSTIYTSLVNEVLNFIQKVIVQPQLDTAEWMRGQALSYGQINWTFGDLQLAVDYGIPAENIFSTRTNASSEAYHAAGSKFWTDWRDMKRKLRNNWRASIMHPDTWEAIADNEANNIQVTNFTDGDGIKRVTFKRYRNVVAAGGGGPAIVITSEDQRDMGEVVLYDLESEVYDLQNEGKTKKVPFIPIGVITNIARNSRSTYRVGEGATDNPEYDLALGYTHIAPTVEGNGAIGRWARTFAPEANPWALTGQSASNLLPVIEAPDKIVTLSTEMPA